MGNSFSFSVVILLVRFSLGLDQVYYFEYADNTVVVRQSELSLCMLTSSLVYSLCSLPQAGSFILKCLFGPTLLLMSFLAVLEVF